MQWIWGKCPAFTWDSGPESTATFLAMITRGMGSQGVNLRRRIFMRILMLHGMLSGLDMASVLRILYSMGRVLGLCPPWILLLGMRSEPLFYTRLWCPGWGSLFLTPRGLGSLMLFWGNGFDDEHSWGMLEGKIEWIGGILDFFRNLWYMFAEFSILKNHLRLISNFKFGDFIVLMRLKFCSIFNKLYSKITRKIMWFYLNHDL